MKPGLFFNEVLLLWFGNSAGIEVKSTWQGFI